MQKINFTQEHLTRLQTLFLVLGFSGKTLSGKFGANSYTVWDLLHNTNITTLQGINQSLKKEVATLETQDEWSMNDYQQKKAGELKQWNEYVFLLIGYKKDQYQQQEEAIKLRAEKERKLMLLKNIKDEVEIAALKKLSPEEIDAQIVTLS